MASVWSLHGLDPKSIPPGPIKPHLMNRTNQTGPPASPPHRPTLIFFPSSAGFPGCSDPFRHFYTLISHSLLIVPLSPTDRFHSEPTLGPACQTQTTLYCCIHVCSSPWNPLHLLYLLPRTTSVLYRLTSLHRMFLACVHACILLSTLL